MYYIKGDADILDDLGNYRQTEAAIDEEVHRCQCIEHKSFMLLQNLVWAINNSPGSRNLRSLKDSFAYQDANKLVLEKEK